MSTNSIWDLDLHEFIERAASREPVPGGGSVAAVAAAQGLALVLMSLEVSARRKDAHPDLGPLLRQGRELLPPLRAAADEDIRAFTKYLEAMRLPKVTPEQESSRRQALLEATSEALQTPLRAAERCLEGLILAREAVRVVHAGIVSDAGAGAALLHGALTAILYNVDINARSVTEPSELAEAVVSREELQRRADELDYVIRKETAAKLRK